jgi:ATP-dependent protease ClpP protease subunit
MKSLILILLFLASCTSYGADFNTKLQPNSCWQSGIQINGTIEKGDFNKFVNNLYLLKNKYGASSCQDGQTYIFLASNGGDIEEAIKIGEEIRKNNLVAIVPENSNCLSACVFIMAGGSKRILLGQIGIHRPYFVDLQDGLTYQQIRQKLNSLNEKIKNYLNDVDVPLSLLEAMQSVPPDNIKILSYSEASSFRLNQTDATVEEKETASNAKFYNLTSAEFRKRSSLISQTCGGYINDGNAYANCMTSLLLGVSMQEIQFRKSKLLTTCNKQDKSYTECYRNILILGK